MIRLVQLAQVGAQARRRVPLAVVLVDPRLRQRAGGRQRAPPDLDHRHRAGGQSRRDEWGSVVDGGVVPVPGHDHQEPHRDVVGKGWRLLDSIA